MLRNTSTTRRSSRHGVRHKKRPTLSSKRLYSNHTGKSPLQVYDEGVRNKLLHEDPRQRGTITRLNDLYNNINKLPSTYSSQFQLDIVKPSSETSTSKAVIGFFSIFNAAVKNDKPSFDESSTHKNVEMLLEKINSGKIQSVKGMYIHGGVGCGKTMMMDMFFDQIPTHIPKVRKHFHSFMLEIHSKVHQIRQDAKIRGIPATDPLPRIAKQFVKEEGTVLCLDEFQVTDVADAMILKELFSSLFACGCVVVSTSNRKPDDLYYNGINRDSFLPFIDVLKQRCDIISMDAMTDYRTLVAQEEGLIHTPLSPQTQQTMDKIYDKLHYGQNDSLSSHSHGLVLEVAMGRTLTVNRCVPKRVARFHFNELCEQAIGAADYMAIAKEFPCLLIEHIPVLYSDDRMKLRRFITLLDVLYEHRTKVYISAESPLDGLFRPTASRGDVDTGASKDTNNPLLLGANQDEVFASARAMSRLIEMTSTSYLSGEFHQQGSKDTKSFI